MYASEEAKRVSTARAKYLTTLGGKSGLEMVWFFVMAFVCRNVCGLYSCIDLRVYVCMHVLDLVREKSGRKRFDMM